MELGLVFTRQPKTSSLFKKRGVKGTAANQEIVPKQSGEGESSRLWGVVDRKVRKVLRPKPCKAVIEVVLIGRPALCRVIFGSEPIQFTG
jgi:hypothetical protein